MNEKRECLYCGKQFSRKPGEQRGHFVRRKTCDKQCSNDLRAKNYKNGTVKTEKALDVLSPLTRIDRPLTRDETELIRGELHDVQKKIESNSLKQFRPQYEAVERRYLDILRYHGGAWMRADVAV